MIKSTGTGNFKKLNSYFERLKGVVNQSTLDKYGKLGVEALASATPVNTGKTASSWYYEIVRSRDSVSIEFNNSNIQDGVHIALILNYGHGTGGGGYVAGINYIDPAIAPIFNKLADDAWREIKNL